MTDLHGIDRLHRFISLVLIGVGVSLLVTGNWWGFVPLIVGAVELELLLRGRARDEPAES